jgi:amino acid transporter
MLVLYYGLTRIILAMSRDGLITPYLSHVSPITQTPVRVIVITGIIMATAAGLDSVRSPCRAREYWHACGLRIGMFGSDCIASQTSRINTPF